MPSGPASDPAPLIRYTSGSLDIASHVCATSGCYLVRVPWLAMTPGPHVSPVQTDPGTPRMSQLYVVVLAVIVVVLLAVAVFRRLA